MKNLKKILAVMLILTASITAISGCTKKPVVETPTTDTKDKIILRELKVDDYVTLGDYKNLKVEKKITEITDEKIQNFIDQTYADGVPESMGIKDRNIVSGDMVNFDVTIKTSDENPDEIKSCNVKVGAGQFIEGFDEHLLNKKSGDTETFELTFPEDYKSDPELAGKKATFTVKVNYIVPIAEKTDDIVKKLNITNITTVAMFESWAATYMKEQAELQDETQFSTDVLDAFIESCTFKNLPESMINDYKALARTNLENIAAQTGTNIDDYVKYYHNSTVDEFVNKYADDAVKQNIAMQAVANREGLTISDDYIKEQLKSYVDGYTYKTVEEVLETIGDIEVYRDYYMYERVYNYLIETAKKNLSK